MSFYKHSALYSALFAPSEEMRTSVDALVRAHKPAGRAKPRSVLDPACGPGLWLEHFARRGARAAGIELEPSVAEAARARIKRSRGAIAVGDMRAPPRGIKGPFDLAINLDNSVGHLGGAEDLAAHLGAMHRLLDPKGIYLLGLAVHERIDELAPSVMYERGPLEVEGGGFVAIRSESLGLHKSDGLLCERIRHYVMTAGVRETAPLFIEQYDLVTFPLETLKKILRMSGPWQVLDCRDATDESLPKRALRKGCGDVLLVLRPRESKRTRAGR